jgi:hypothetical protein
VEVGGDQYAVLRVLEVAAFAEDAVEEREGFACILLSVVVVFLGFASEDAHVLRDVRVFDDCYFVVEVLECFLGGIVVSCDVREEERAERGEGSVLVMNSLSRSARRL